MLHQNSPPSNSIIVDFDIRLILVSDNFCICFLKGQFCFSFACLIIIKIWVLEITHKNRRFVSFLLIVQCEETKREMVYYYMTIPSLKAWARLITCWCSIINRNLHESRSSFNSARHEQRTTDHLRLQLANSYEFTPSFRLGSKRILPNINVLQRCEQFLVY